MLFRTLRYLVLASVLARSIWHLVGMRKSAVQQVRSPSSSVPRWAEKSAQPQSPTPAKAVPKPAASAVVETNTVVFGRFAGALSEFAAGRSLKEVKSRATNYSFDCVGFAKARGELAEDAFACSKTEPIFALADGASSSSQAGEWALALCKLWVSSGSLWNQKSLAELVAPLQDEFTGASVAAEASPSTWFAEEVTRRGAHAAFLGVRIVPSGKSRYEVQAVSYGDVCMLVYTKDRLVQSFPIAEHSDFTSFPALLSSNEMPSDEKLLISKLAVEPDSRVILATDGVASLLLHPKVSRSTVRAVVSGTAKQCGKKLMDARETGLLDDDDYTLIRIVVT